MTSFLRLLFILSAVCVINISCQPSAKPEVSTPVVTAAGNVPGNTEEGGAVARPVLTTGTEQELPAVPKDEIASPPVSEGPSAGVRVEPADLARARVEVESALDALERGDGAVQPVANPGVAGNPSVEASSAGGQDFEDVAGGVGPNPFVPAEGQMGVTGRGDAVQSSPASREAVGNMDGQAVRSDDNAFAAEGVRAFSPENGGDVAETAHSDSMALGGSPNNPSFRGSPRAESGGMSDMVDLNGVVGGVPLSADGPVLVMIPLPPMEEDRKNPIIGDSFLAPPLMEGVKQKEGSGPAVQGTELKEIEPVVLVVDDKNSAFGVTVNFTTLFSLPVMAIVLSLI